jgi:peptide/nickel transport system permease protein
MSQLAAPELALAELEAGVPAADLAARGTVARALRMGRTRIGLAIDGLIVLVAVVGPALAPHSSTQFVGAPFTGAGGNALFGTDNLGRDVLSRFLWGGRSVIVLALAAAILGVGAGTLIGLVAAYGRGKVDDLLMRSGDVLLAFPQIVLALLLLSMVGPHLWLVVAAVALGHAPQTARVIRGAALEVVERDYVRVAEMMGESRMRILARELLPNVSSPLLVELGLRLTYSIGLVAGIEFLGFGQQPPSADWGLMINENRVGLTGQPWGVVLPIVAIGLLTIGTNLTTDGLARAAIGIDRGESR